MYKTLSVFALVVLGLLVVFQRQTIVQLETELTDYKDAVNALELHMARTGGELSGLRITSGVREQSLGSSLSKHRDRLSELQQLMAVKDHLIQSLTKGHTLTISAYSPEPAQTDDSPFITASNHRVRDGIVAVSRDLYNKGWVFGREVYIKGLGVYIIDDLMHERKTDQLDIFMFSTAQAMRFGRKKMRVFLLGS